MTVLSRLASGVRYRTTRKAAVEHNAALSSHMSGKVRAHAGPSSSTDTFTRQRITTSQSPPESPSADNGSYECQLLPRLDLERLQAKPKVQDRSRWLVVS